MRKDKILKYLNSFELYIGTVLLVAMFVLLNLQVVSRYVFKHSLTWTEELSTILFVWIAYIGASAAVFKAQHLRIDILLNALKGKAKKTLLIITDLITMGFCLYMVVPIVDIIQHFTELNTKTLMLRIPKDLIYWVLPIALVLTAVRFGQEIYNIIKSPPEEEIKVVGKTIFDDIEELTDQQVHDGRDS